jgi:hypothetical protein
LTGIHYCLGLEKLLVIELLPNTNTSKVVNAKMLKKRRKLEHWHLTGNHNNGDFLVHGVLKVFSHIAGFLTFLPNTFPLQVALLTSTTVTNQ